MLFVSKIALFLSSIPSYEEKLTKRAVSNSLTRTLLRGMRLAMYIVGQERRLVNPPSQVVAGVRTVTTNMNGRDVLPRLSRPFAFFVAFKFPAIKSRK
jgi:hypothetical protein